MSTHQIHVFISHSWSHSHHYNILEDWIFGRSWSKGPASLFFHNYSVPRTDPIHNAPTSAKLKEAIYNQIKRSHVIIIPSGVYATHSEWIQKEITGAKEHAKPILAVDPRGAQRTSSIVQQHADHTVGWSSQSVIDGIWQLYYR